MRIDLSTRAGGARREGVVVENRTGRREASQLSEEEAARDPAALAGREQLEARLARLSPEQIAAFRAALRRCYRRGPEA